MGYEKIKLIIRKNLERHVEDSQKQGKHGLLLDQESNKSSTVKMQNHVEKLKDVVININVNPLLPYKDVGLEIVDTPEHAKVMETHKIQVKKPALSIPGAPSFPNKPCASEDTHSGEINSHDHVQNPLKKKLKYLGLEDATIDISFFDATPSVQMSPRKLAEHVSACFIILSILLSLFLFSI